MLHDFTCSPEIQHLIYPIDQSAYAELQAGLLSDGCLEPITVWQDTIVDGQKRYQICERFDIPYEITDISDLPWSEVIRRVCDAQLQRSDISFAMRRYLVGKSFQAILEGRRLQAQSGAPQRPNRPLVPKQKTAREVASEFNMSYATILKYESYAAAVDEIRTKYEPLAKNILSDAIRLSQDNAGKLAGLAEAELEAINRSFERGEIEHIDSALIRRHAGDTSPGREPVVPDEPLPAVRRMPEYDPDAELSSLTFTIPSWIKTIERTQAGCNYEDASMKAKLRLMQSLHLLEHTVAKFKNEMEENYLYG